MAHSYANNLVHCVFSTQERRNLIAVDLQPRLWAYVIGVSKNHGIEALATGGTANHAHTLIALPANMALSKAIQTIKANSSRWVREHGIEFAWQEGYGAFSVSASQAPAVKAYIHNQAEHHKKRSFEDEFLALLKKSGVPYDPKFVFG
jgi:REP element-mobilizing transposase RayT